MPDKRKTDSELDRLWDRINELWIRRDGESTRGEHTHAMEKERDVSRTCSDRDRALIQMRLKKEIARLEEEVNLPVVYAPSPDPASGIDATADARAAFGGHNSPMGEMWPLANSSKIDWRRNSRDWRKAYFFACLSEIVYLHLGKYELKGKDRYKIIPSEALRLLLERDIRLDFARVLATTELPIVTVTDNNNFLLANFRFHTFTVVAIRGTAPVLEDIAIDLKEMMLLVNGRGYHMGFYNEAQRALLPLREAVKEENNPIYFVGHSLGGALSALLAKMWTGPENVMVPYTFGSPRFGNQSTARSHPVHAFVRKFDPVPYLPPSLSGYRSAGWPPTMVPPEDQLPRGWAFRKLAVSAHRIGEYRRLIGRQIQTPEFPAEIYYEALKKRLLSK